MPRTVSAAVMAQAFQPGERVFLPGSAGEPSALLDAMVADPETSRGLRITSTAVPGINQLPMDALHPTAEATGLFMQPSLRRAQAEGRFHTLPLSFAGFAAHVRDRLEVDTCVVQVAPPDRNGRCSLGAAVEFTLLAAAKAGRLFAVLNPAMPAIPGAGTLPFDALTLVTEADTALPAYDVGTPSAEALAIAAGIAELVEDGSTLQAGLGKVPEAMFGLLRDRRGLRLRSGMLSDGALELQRAGALDETFTHASCVWVGSSALYEELRMLEGFAVLGCDRTHDVPALARMDRFVAVNSALEVDLFGQANLEHANGRAVSGIGGALDFATAARLSRGGISMVALPSAHGTPPRSRIVKRIADGTVSLPRQLVDVVITEHGTADLRGRTVTERAEALIGIAAPILRDTLAEEWRELRRKL